MAALRRASLVGLATLIMAVVFGVADLPPKGQQLCAYFLQR